MAYLFNMWHSVSFAERPAPTLEFRLAVNSLPLVYDEEVYVRMTMT